MKQLKDILYKAGIEELHGNTSAQVKSVRFDSRKVEKGDVFFAVPGTQVDGHDYIEKTIELGATAIVCEILPEARNEAITYIKVQNSAAALAIAASNYYDNPSEKLKLVAITGTNGKTSIATLLYDLFRRLGYSVGLLSTIENKIDGQIIKATHTTPDAIQLNELLAEMVEKGCEYCFMEASSHAIHQRRIDGLQFTGALFTNITHDHLDYHQTFKEYINAKKRLFDILSPRAFALTNADDKNGAVMLQNTKAKKLRYALKTIGNYSARILESSFSGIIMQIDGEELHTRLIGHFNAYNILSVYATARELGMEKMETLTALSDLTTVEGRFDFSMSPKEKIIGIVDYAHTPDALKKVLETINNIRTGGEQLVSVVGCGGNRDKAKRPLMAEVAAALSDKVILTSDNPRDEEPGAILQEMERGISPVHKKKVLKITDRREAIETAISLVQTNDIVLVAGKGHEKYQEIKGQKLPFDDKAILLNAFKTQDK